MRDSPLGVGRLTQPRKSILANLCITLSQPERRKEAEVACIVFALHRREYVGEAEVREGDSRFQILFAQRKREIKRRLECETRWGQRASDLMARPTD